MSCTDITCFLASCSGGNGVNPIDFWANNDCPMVYYTEINTTGSSFQYNPTNLVGVQNYVVNLFDTYLQTHKFTDEVTGLGYNPFQETLIDLCSNASLPGVCGLYLGGGENVVGFCSKFTREEAMASKVLTDLCGCYVPPDSNYLKYTLGSPGCEIGEGCTAGCTLGQAGCTGQPACDPLCHRAMTSQKSYVPSGNLITCPQNVCAINDVTINISGSRVPGGINFNSICSSCGGPDGADGCLCVVSGLNISSTLSQIGIGLNYSDFCSADSIAIITDESGNIISELPLSQADPNPTNAVPTYSPALSWGLVGLALLILFILIILIHFYAKSKRYKISLKERIEERKINREYNTMHGKRKEGEGEKEFQKNFEKEYDEFDSKKTPKKGKKK